MEEWNYGKIKREPSRRMAPAAPLLGQMISCDFNCRFLASGRCIGCVKDLRYSIRFRDHAIASPHQIRLPDDHHLNHFGLHRSVGNFLIIDLLAN